MIPYELHLDGTFTPTGGDPETFSEDVVKPAPRHGRTDHCTFHEVDIDEFGTLVLDGEVFVSYTQRAEPLPRVTSPAPARRGLTAPRFGQLATWQSTKDQLKAKKI